MTRYVWVPGVPLDIRDRLAIMWIENKHYTDGLERVGQSPCLTSCWYLVHNRPYNVAIDCYDRRSPLRHRPIPGGTPAAGCGGGDAAQLRRRSAGLRPLVPRL